MDDLNLRCVYEAGDPFKIQVVKAMLETFDIPSTAHGCGIPDLFGYGRVGAGFNITTGTVKLMVREDDLERAASLIEQNIDTDESPPEIPESEWSQGTDDLV